MKTFYVHVQLIEKDEHNITTAHETFETPNIDDERDAKQLYEDLVYELNNLVDELFA